MPLIGFVGAPGTGKTTVAAKIYSYFKDIDNGGYVADLITDVGRRRLFTKRVTRMTVDDHQQVFREQLMLENAYTDESPNSLVITDNCIFNSLIYWSEASEKVRQVVIAEMKRYDLIFYCPRLDTQLVPGDRGRIEDADAALKIETSVQAHLTSIAPAGVVEVLAGTLNVRAAEAVTKIRERIRDKYWKVTQMPWEKEVEARAQEKSQ